VIEVNEKFAQWKELYEQYKDAQDRLDKSRREPPCDANMAALKTEVARLGKASNVALEEAQAALAAHKTGVSRPAPLS
jgi:Tfp pilus assembly protein PilO